MPTKAPLIFKDPKNPPKGWDTFSDIHPDFQKPYDPVAYATENLIVMIKLTQGIAFVSNALKGKAGESYMEKVRKALWSYGMYHYGESRTLDGAENEADHFITEMTRLECIHDGMLPPWLDYEESKGIIDKVQRWIWIKRWCKRVKYRLSIILVSQDPVLNKLKGVQRRRIRRRIARKMRPSLYAGSFLRDKVMVGPNNIRLHLAAYAPSPFPWLPKFWQAIKIRMKLFWFWQFTSKSSTKGVPKPHDRNHVMVSPQRFYRLKLDLTKYYPKGAVK